MPTTLQRFANGDTNYIAKHNSNAGVLEATLNALDAIISGVTGAGALTIASAYEALFGTTVALIGSTSYTQSTASTNLTITSGYCWKQSVLQIVKSVSSTVLPFSGVAAGTYYIEIDASGAPTRVSSSTEPVYTVVWSGSSFTSVTRNAPIVWAAADWIAAQTSAALAASYDSLDARLEAGEAKAVLGDLARTYQSAALSKSVAGGTDVALSDAEANHQIITLTGALTANINVTIVHATSPKTWIVNNQTSGAFTLTFKGTTGTGVVLPQGSASIVCSNATNVLPVLVADTDTTLAANSDLRFATQKAVKTYIDGIVTGGATDVMIFKGIIDCSANPNYPAADAGHLYKISVAGKIGGASGPDVEAHDTIYCITDSTASGTHAAVGANWVIAQANLSSQPYDLGGAYTGAPTSSVVMMRYKFPRTVVFAAGLSPSQGVAAGAATAQTDIDIQKNATSVGTMRFAAAGTSATFIMASQTSFATGDVLTLVAPGTPDATLANIAWTLSGVR
jgi:hypothetical protein